jgi:hypothetical protein
LVLGTIGFAYTVVQENGMNQVVGWTVTDRSRTIAAKIMKLSGFGDGAVAAICFFDQECSAE